MKLEEAEKVALSNLNLPENYLYVDGEGELMKVYTGVAGKNSSDYDRDLFLEEVKKLLNR